MDLGLHDRVYVISGGSRGLGLATARALIAEGARVLLLGRDVSHLQSALQQLGSSAHAMEGDLADAHVASQACDKARHLFGRLDGALISGGGPAPGSAMSVSDEQWRQDFEAVFLGGLRLAREVLSSSEPMSVAWVLSTSAVEPVTGLPTSNGLRPGLAMVIKDLADEVAPRGSRINGLLPGRISTDRIAELDRNRGPEATARTLAGIPMGRYGEPEEFARVAAFVLSPAASYVTGTLIRIDGGLTRQP